MAFYIKENDTSPSYQVTLRDFDGSVINVTDSAVNFHMYDLDGTMKVDSAAVIVNGTGGVVKYEWAEGDTDTIGTYRAEWEVTYTDATVETFPNNDYETVVVVGELA